jgi:PAT family beta-lactamase induction signal transducer AmpG
MNEIELVGAEATAEADAAGGDAATVQAKDKPWLFGLMIAPSAVVANGVVQGGVLAYLLSQQGMSSDEQARLIQWLALPTSLYFLWSPITDFFVRRRTWLLTGAVLAAVLMAIAFRQPSLSSHGALLLILVSACCSQLVVSSCGGMMGALHSDGSRKQAGSIYQAGSMGFGALATWLLVLMSSRTSQANLGLIAAVAIAGPALFALAAPEQSEMAAGSFGTTMRRVWSECKATFLRRSAIPYVMCMTFPMASGSAIGLLTGVAAAYGVHGDSVAWMNGWGGGLLTAAGAAGMAVVPFRMRASVMYMVVALINCATLCILWLGPLAPGTYYVGSMLYFLTTGACYAMFTAVVLEFLGKSGKSGSGRYSIINSLGNVPVLYMLRVDGKGAKWFGPRGLTGAEAVVGGVGAAVLLMILLWMKPKGEAEGLAASA